METTVYFFETDDNGKEITEPVAVTLNANGTADVSLLPDGLRESLETEGMPDEMHMGSVFPADGQRFLAALLRESNPYLRFRSTSKKLD